MEKTLMGLVAAIGAAAPLAGAHAAVVSNDEANRALQVTSVAELLEPVANPMAVLAALNSQPRSQSAPHENNVQLAWHHHHHHHHHHWYHHHHHHHHWYHHHHHHHHNYYYPHHHHHYYYHHHHHSACFFSPLGWICP
jgi:hypothetical protein